MNPICPDCKEEATLLIPCHDGVERCEACCKEADCCPECGAISAMCHDDTPEWAVFLCSDCRRAEWDAIQTFQDDLSFFPG